MLRERYTEKELGELLERRYSCTCDGKDISPPYRSTGEMPTYYLSPSGLCFSVPPPPDGVGYSRSIVEEIIRVAKLDVVVGFERRSDVRGIED